MAVDNEKVKDALDDFEDDKFTDAKEKLSDVIGKARDDFLKKALNLKGEPEKKEEPEDKEDEKEEKETKDDAKEKDASSKEDEKKANKKRISKAIKKKQDK